MPTEGTRRRWLAAVAALPFLPRPAEARKAQRLARGRLRCPDRECGFIYDPAVGIPEQGIPPGIAFEDLPDDWTCPVCGISKDVWI